MKKGFKRLSQVSTVAMLSCSLVLSNQVINPSSVEASGVSEFTDYNSSAYWAKSFEWAVGKGLISGYQNTTQPGSTSKQVGNWVAPDGKLSESQAVTVMMKYFEDARLKTTKNPTSHWAGSSLQLAKELGVPLVGGTANVKQSDGYTMTRGDFARMLANLHFGKELTQANAIQFMYDTGITSGMDANAGKTIANFGTNVKLNRAHIVSFMQRYNDYVEANTVVNQYASVVNIPKTYNAQIPAQNNVVSAKIASTSSYERIKVRYGDHTYGCNNQAEYDAVMKIIDEAVKNFDSLPLSWNNSNFENDEFEMSAYTDVMTGQFNMATTQLDKNSNEYFARIAQWNSAKGLVLNGVPLSVVKDIDRAAALVLTITSSAKNNEGSPVSAYDALVRKVIDCDARSQVYSAIFDTMGYNTATKGKTNHASPLVEIQGKWYQLEGSYSLATEGGLPPASNILLTQPTR